MVTRSRTALFAFVIAIGLAAIGCDTALPETQSSAASAAKGAEAKGPPGAGAHGDSYAFSLLLYDIDATPDGSILVAQNTALKEIRHGRVGDVAEIPVAATAPPTTVNGLAAIGRGNTFATSGGGDVAEGAALWRVSQGGARMVADLGQFERDHDPDAALWKDPRCEFDPVQGFSAGPQANPYHLAALSGSEALVADAAANTLLYAKANGEVEWVAVFTPPTGADGYRVLFPLDSETDCYVQPVPTSVAIGPDGAYYVGELTGVTPEELGGGVSTGLSRVWRIEAGVRHVVCPSVDCVEVVSGLTSVIDVAFGPDGALYVAEMDANGWWAAAVVGGGAGGTIKRCDARTGTCELVEQGDAAFGAITFDKRGALWVAENDFGTGSAAVRRVSLP